MKKFLALILMTASFLGLAYKVLAQSATNTNGQPIGNQSVLNAGAYSAGGGVSAVHQPIAVGPNGEVYTIPGPAPAIGASPTNTPGPTATPISNSPSINYNCAAVTVLNKATPNAFATVVIPGGLTDNHQLCFSIAGISGGASIINTFGLQPVNGANAFIYGTGNFSNSTCAVANQKPCSVISYQISPNATPSGATTLIFNTCDWNN